MSVAARIPISRFSAAVAAAVLAGFACPAGARGAAKDDPPSRITPDQAAEYVGRTVDVEGTILSARIVRSISGRHCVLGFGPSIGRGLTVVIYPRVYAKMPRRPEVYFRNRQVRVRGTISLRDGEPRILLTSPGRIRRIAGDEGDALDAEGDAPESDP